MHFGITEKPMTDCLSLNNNVDLISKATEEIASENAANCRCRQPHCRLTLAPHGTPVNIHIELILPEVESLSTRAILCGSVFIQTFLVGSESACFVQYTAYRPFKVIQGRWFWQQSKGRMDFLLVINNNLGLILHRFWDTATCWLKIANFTYPLSLNALARVNPFEFLDERDPTLRRFDTLPACDGQTNRQTDIRTTRP